MCGIAGIFSYRSSGPTWDEAELVRIRESMISRGPDGRGLWRSPDGRLGLAHRRLAIIDPSPAGLQPMVSQDEKFVLVYNGEIYNYRELRGELHSRGVEFRTGTDTEVILRLYEREGAEMLCRLRGMFAFALWDAPKRTLFLARDPFGIKPLYFADDGRTFRFASQVKALAAGGRIDGRPSPAGVAGFFIWGHVPEPWTWLEAVRALPAGTWLEVRDGAPTGPPRRYFDLREEIIAAEAESRRSRFRLEEALEAVADSVRHHLVADVPVGVFLSADKDSNLVSSLAMQSGAVGMRAITLGFQEYQGTTADEVPPARESASLIGLDHDVACIGKSDFDEERDRLLDAMDQPTIDGVNTYFVCRAAHRAGWKVALSGLGGDELFGGYTSFRQVPMLASRLRAAAALPWLGRLFRRVCASPLRRAGKAKWAGVLEFGGTLGGAYLLRRALFGPWELEKFLDPRVLRDGSAELDLPGSLDSAVRGIRTQALQVMFLEYTHYMRDQLLRDADWAGMAHSLEIRVPLVDVSLFRRWIRLGASLLPFDRGLLLQRALSGACRQLTGRPKSGFGIPTAEWLGYWRRPSLRGWAQRVGREFTPGCLPFRVLVLLTDAYGSAGGISRFNRDFLNALNEMPDCKAVYTFPRIAPPAQEIIPPKIRWYASSAGSKLLFLWKVLNFGLSGPEFDIVVCAHVNLMPLAAIVRVFRKSPLLLNIHGVEAWSPHRSRLVRHSLRLATRVLSVSRITSERFIAWSNVRNSRVIIIPCCVDLSRYSPGGMNESLKARYGLNGKRILLTIGRIVSSERYKGFDEVLDILPSLIQREPDLFYVIVGDGSDRRRLEAKARALGIHDRVLFTGFVPEGEKIDWYRAADVFVMPGRGEGFGIVYLEAMACGIPVIGSTLDGSREALKDGELGILVDPTKPQALAEAILAALQRPRGRPAGIEYFSVPLFNGRTKELIRWILSESIA